MIGLDQRVVPLDPLLPQRVRVVHLENRVLLHDPEQHHQANRAVHVQRHAEGHQREQSRGQAERQRRHDCQRVNEAVELRGKHHVDEDDGEHHRDGEIVRRFGQRPCAAAEHCLVAWLQVELVDLRARRPERFAERNALQVGVHRDLPLAVVPVDRRRTVVVLQRGDVAHLDGLGRAGRNEQVAQRFDIAIRLVEPQQDLELIVAVLVLRHFFAAHERPQAVGERVDVDAEIGRARAIDVDAQLRLRRLEVRIDVDYAWNRAHLVHQLHGVLLQLFDVRSLNQDVQAIEASAAALTATAARAPTAGGRTGDVGAARDADARALIFPQRLTGADHQLLLRHVAFLERQHRDIEVREARVDVLHDALQRGQREHFLLDRLDEFLGPLVAGAAGQPDVDAELALVVVGYELLADVRIKERGGERDGAGDADHHRTMVQRPMEHLAVDRIQPGIPAGGLRRRVIGFRVLFAEPHRAQRGRQRERDEHRQQDGCRRGEAEAVEVAADLARHERDRHEDDHERERRRHDGEADLLRRFGRRFLRRHALLLDESEDVLEHDDGVVDDDAGRERQREHRHVVQREAGHFHERERPDDRRRDGQRGDERHADVADEQEHDDAGEQAAENQVELDVLERAADEARLIVADADLNVLR